MSSYPSSGSRRPWLAWAIAALLLALAVFGIRQLMRASPDEGQRSVIQQITMVQEPPPPPPPPEPEEKIMEEEPEVVEPTEDPQVQEDSEPPSDDSPDDAPATAEPAGVDRPADAGSDSFRLAAGKGGGLFGRGGGGGRGAWGAYVETHIRRALQQDPRTRLADGNLDVVVDIDSSGRFVSARLRSSSGDAELDRAIEDVLRRLPPLARGRPPGIAGETYASINLKRL